MAIKKVKVLHVRGSNARPMWLMVMDDVGEISAYGYTNYYPTYNAANNEMITNTSGAYPSGINTGVTIGMSTHAIEFKNRCFASTFQKVLNISDLAQGDKIVFDNGSYLLVKLQADPVNPNAVADAFVDINYFTKDDEAPFGAAASFRIHCTYGYYQGIAGRYYFNADVIPWRCKTIGQYGYAVYRCSIECQYQSSLGVYVPTFMNRWQGVVLGDRALSIKFFDGITELEPDDPYPDVPDSGEEEPDPEGIPEPDDIPFPDDPDINVTDLGFVTLYAPTRAQLKDLSDFMWSSFFDIDSLKKLFTDPMDCILGLNMLPFHVNQGSAATVYLGNISSGVSMPTALSQWQTISCGSVNIGQVYDTYLDYSPYTKMHIFLPFIGIQELNTDDVAHKVISVKYKIDVLSCACIAFIMADDVVLYQFSGTCGYSVPVTAMDFSSLFRASVDVAISAATLAASAGAGGAGAAAGGSSGLTATAAMDASTSAQIAQFASNSAGAIGNSKTRVKRSGALSGGPGIMGVQKPYLILEIPRICKPARQQHFLGYPSFITIQVSGISGYAEFESIILSGVTCTEEERHMLSNIFKGGVYV